MIEEKTITLTVAEFRKNIKASLDFAVQGGIVIIDRMGQRFLLSNIGRDSDILIGSSKGVQLQHTPPEKKSPGASHQPSKPFGDQVGEIQPRIKSPGTPFRTEEEWQEAEALEQKCCKANSPCRHWYFEPERNLWVNTLSKREREVV